jgi:hypothetical protein
MSTYSVRLRPRILAEQFSFSLSCLWHAIANLGRRRGRPAAASDHPPWRRSSPAFSCSLTLFREWEGKRGRYSRDGWARGRGGNIEARNPSYPCNLAYPPMVYIFDASASGRLVARQVDRIRAPLGNRAKEGGGKLQRRLQQACNMPATTLQLWRHSGVAKVLLRCCTDFAASAYSIAERTSSSDSVAKVVAKSDMA